MRAIGMRLLLCTCALGCSLLLGSLNCGPRALGTGGSGASGVTSGMDHTGGGSTPTCNGGCLCFSTVETCPSDCVHGHRADGSFVCGYACDAPGVPCNCVYRPDDGGIYVCDAFIIPACPSLNAFTGGPMGACDSAQGPCLTCSGTEGPAECVCDGGWSCLGTEEACSGP
jgi:hypothetical protein